MTGEAATLGLRAVNDENSVLTHDPESSFFISRHPRHTLFSIAYLRQSIGSNDTGGPSLINTSAPPGLRDVNDNLTSLIYTPIERSGDLIGRIHVRSVMPALNTMDIVNEGSPGVAGVPFSEPSPLGAGYQMISGDAVTAGPIESTVYPDLAQGGYCYSDEVGTWMIEEASVNIGSHTIDRTSSEQRYAQWHVDHSDERLMEHALGIGSRTDRIRRAYDEQVIYSPLEFFFSQNPCHYFPLISMSQGDLTIGLRGRSWYSLYGGVRTGSGLLTPDLDQYSAARDEKIRAAMEAAHQDLVVECVFLDASERSMFASSALEYVITLSQMETRMNVAANVENYGMSRVNIQHPTRDLTVLVRPVSRTRADALLDDKQPDSVYPVRTAPPSGPIPNPYHTPIKWNDFSGGMNPATGERTESLRNLKLEINGFNRLLSSDAPMGPLYREVDPVARKTPGRTHDTFGYHYSFGLSTQGASTSGSINFSAISRIDLTLNRAQDPLSTLAPSGVGAYDAALVAAGLYPPPQYQAVDVFLMTRCVNVLRLSGGHAGVAFAV